MAKVIKGTKDAKVFEVLKGQSDTRQLRCKKCGGLAIQVPDGSGGTVYQCTGCPARYSFTTI